MVTGYAVCLQLREENKQSWALSALVPEPHLHVHGRVQASAGRCGLLGFLLLLFLQALLLFLGPAASWVLETTGTCSTQPHANPAQPGRQGGSCPRSH